MCVRFPRLRPGDTTVHSVLPPLFRLSFRVHLGSIFRFRAFAAHSCYGTISFRVSVYFPFGWSSRPVGGPGEGFHDNIRLVLRVDLCMHVGYAKHNVDLRWLGFGPMCHLPSHFQMIGWGNTQGLLPHLE